MQDNIHTLAISLFSITTPNEGLQEKYFLYKEYLDKFLDHKDIWYQILGKDKKTRILVLNQNNDELRA